MATSPDHPGLPYVQAKGYTRGRPDGPPLWIVVHDMEAGESSSRAESTAAYFANPSDGRQVSSHYVVDNDSVIQCVRLADSAWTVGNRPGNNRGINWELAGFARQSRAEWLDAFGVAMFAQAAPIAAADMRRYAIPNRWCTVDDLLHYRPGLTTHNDLRLAFGVTTHTDPGPNFPRDYLTQLLDAELNPKPAHPKGRRMFRLIDPENGQFVVSPDTLSPTGWSYVQINPTVEGWMLVAAGIGTANGSANDPNRDPHASDKWRPGTFGPSKAEVRTKLVEDIAAKVLALLPASGGATLEQIRDVVDEELDEQSRAGADID